MPSDNLELLAAAYKELAVIAIAAAPLLRPAWR